MDRLHSNDQSDTRDIDWFYITSVLHMERMSETSDNFGNLKNI